jgi:type IV pilus assembly protein PilC
MPKFTYTAIDSSGREKTGKIDASSEADARSKLSGQGLMVSSMDAERTSAKHGGKKLKPARRAGMAKRIKEQELTVFTRQLATLMAANLPLLRALEVMIRQEKKPRFKAVIESIADKVRSGSPLSEGLLAHPRIFPPIYINMVRAGEAGGVLDTVLNRLANFMEKDLRTKKKIQSAMTYPIVVVSVAVVIVSALMMFVVPSFQNIFNEMLGGAALPGLTQFVIGIGNFMKPSSFLHGIVLFIALIMAIFLLKLFFKSKPGRRIRDWLFLNAPVIGDFGTKAAVSRFARTFSTLLASGVPILQSLTITRDVIGNSIVSKGLDKVHDRVRDGESLAVPLEQQHIFPTMVTSMIEVGEETGDLSEMLGRVADNYDEELDNSVSAITSIIEPIMMVFLAIVVGVIVIALFLPIIEIIKSLTQG